MTLDLKLTGADRLAASAREAAAQLGDLDQVAEQAADAVVGHLRHPTGQPSGIAAALRADPAPMGFTIAAHGSSTPFLARFLGDALTAAESDVVELYQTHIGQLVDTIEGA